GLFVFHAGAVAGDADARSRSRTRVRVGLAVAAADRTVFHGADLRLRLADAGRIGDVLADACLHGAVVALRLALETGDAPAHAACFSDGGRAGARRALVLRRAGGGEE